MPALRVPAATTKHRLKCRPHGRGKTSVAYFRVVEGVQGTLGVDHVVEVDVCIAERAASHGVTANPDGRDRTDVTAHE
jgi:hypothetical protein